ncbi:trimeric LpxA-like protein [Macrophomina phaseolina]|uniref:Trimeric LpxA-like protein n=1 Tax=Macrophomina phaseolina TaxID=35725 RepID=A0ABQ8GPA9_9PEZI|nr:trimeric LpxA-like protein [Macrophomina phaseolina]
MTNTKSSSVPFPAADDDFRAARLRCAMACQMYNQMPENATVEHRSRLWRNIVTTGSITPPCEDELEDIAAGRNTNSPFSKGAPYVKPPVYIDYGTMLQVGASTFINRNLTISDTPILPIKIGERCLIGPNTSIYAVGHPLDYRERGGPLGAPSLASSVTIEDDCWVGGSVVIMPGVRIGRGCVIGAGSVVTKVSKESS